MRIFVTGYAGSAVVRDLLNAGHQVLALARPEASAAELGDNRRGRPSRDTGDPGACAPVRAAAGTDRSSTSADAVLCLRRGPA